jgi:hypothetical protein
MRTRNKKVSIRCGSGLGDAIYLQSVARHYVEHGYDVEVCSAWKDVFIPLNGKVTVSPFRRTMITRLAHYSSRRGEYGTTQWQDCCINARIPMETDLRIDWTPLNVDLISRLQGFGKPIVAVQMPRAPFARTDGFGVEFLPDCTVMQRAINCIGRRALLVQIGNGEPFHKFTGIDVDLANKTTVSDVLDIGFAAHGFFGYCSFLVPLAESFSKPLQLIWSKRGLESKHLVVRQMTPQKILHRPSSRAIVDDCSQTMLSGAIDEFCEQVSRKVSV